MKNNFMKSTIVLMIGIMFTKILSFFIRIIWIRMIGNGINIYSLILPTISLVTAVTQLSLPYSLSIVIAKDKENAGNIVKSIIPFTIIFNVIIIIFLILFIPYEAEYLLKNKSIIYPLYASLCVIPFTTLTGIIKGYFFGFQNTKPNAVSSVIEQIIRLLLLVLIIPFFIKKSIVSGITAFIFISVICEIVQIIVYLFFFPTNKKILGHKYYKSKRNEVLAISLPNLFRLFIGNIEYFFEPIIILNILSFIGYNVTFINHEYAIYSMYVIPILTMPSFITMAINTTLAPDISNNINNPNYIKKRLNSILKYSFIIGVLFCSFILLTNDFLPKLIYGTSEGLSYLRLLAIFFPLFYLEGPLVTTLQALNYTKKTLYITTFASLFKIVALIVFSFLSIGIYSIIIAEILHIILVLFLLFKATIKYLQ